MYGTRTANGNLRNHMYKNHPQEYDQAVEQNGWNHRLSSETNDPRGGSNPGNVRKESLPAFSPEAFMEYLVRFIVADDQVSLRL
jgi:hypothetical protein